MPILGEFRCPPGRVTLLSEAGHEALTAIAVIDSEGNRRVSYGLLRKIVDI